MIKHIEVKRRSLDIKPGRKVYTFGMMGKATWVILLDPEVCEFGTRTVLAYCLDSEHHYGKGRARKLYLGDLGVPGYTYDKRPCFLYDSEGEAEAGYKEYISWVTRLQSADLLFSL